LRVVDLIIAKRDGRSLTREEIDFFVAGVTAGTLPNYQASALLMAVCLRGMSFDETAWLTDAMVRSGIRVDLSAIPGRKVDKHSTGGVGDKTSLVVAPIAAACGLAVPMMSGRGLAHTGGTLDKLQSIPGFRVDLSLEQMKAALVETKCAMLGQTAEIAPADKILYALRDVTGTAETVPLIAASVMCKKIAEGIDGLVLDVKTGSGALIQKLEDSRTLAGHLVAIGKASGVRTEAVITDMDVPLGRAVGNALEVIECLEVLKGRGPADLCALSFDLAARMLLLGEVASDRADADRRVQETIRTGQALDVFRHIVEWQGGDAGVVDDYGRLPTAPSQSVMRATRGGYINRVDAMLIGRASVTLGAGRDRVEDTIDPAVGMLVMAKPGDPVREGDALLEVHYRSEAALERALALAGRAVTITDAPPEPRPLFMGEVR
jgi:pyrimidine-nucleoside phosphorylase